MIMKDVTNRKTMELRKTDRVFKAPSGEFIKVRFDPRQLNVYAMTLSITDENGKAVRWGRTGYWITKPHVINVGAGDPAAVRQIIADALEAVVSDRNAEVNFSQFLEDWEK